MAVAVSDRRASFEALVLRIVIIGSWSKILLDPEDVKPGKRHHVMVKGSIQGKFGSVGPTEL